MNPNNQFATQFNPAQSGETPNAAGPSDKLPSAFSLFTPSSQLVIKNFKKFAVLIFLPTAYFALLELFFNPKTADRHVAIWLGLAGVGVVYNVLVFAGQTVFKLRTVQGQQLSLLEVIKLGWHYFWRLLGLYITVASIVIICLLLFIVPGIIMIRRYTLAPYFLIDRNLGIHQAMRQSADTTKGHSGAIWGVIGVQILVGAPSWIPFIGPIISAATSMFYSCALPLRYEQFKALQGQPGAAQPSIQPTQQPNLNA